MKTIAICLLILLLGGCAASDSELPKPVVVEMETNYGTITIQLYHETPLHRDNFVHLVNNAHYDSLQFHRVIEHFVVQGGDPGSKIFPLDDDIGTGGLDYTISPEFVPQLFHKRGAIGAARDDNAERASSSTQFYIVQGRVATDSTLTIAEDRINGWIARHFVRNDPENKALTDSIAIFTEHGNFEKLEQYLDSLNQKITDFTDFERYVIPNAHREIYKTIGGIPHLDQNYTVFGEVISGMNIVDQMASVETDDLDRPVNEVRILKMKVLE